MENSKILWIDLQPSLYCLFKRTAQTLGQRFGVRRWSFEHDPDESCDVDVIHYFLKQTIENSPEPVHLVGHGLSGTVAYLYAKKYPKNIASISLLSVDIHSNNQWTSHYQSMRSQLPCSRFHILSHLSRLLIDTHADHVQNIISRLLAKCLDNDFVSGSIVQNNEIENLGKISIPTLIINGGKDFVVDNHCRKRWEEHLKPGDCYRQINNGRHFFPFSEWSQTSKMIESFIEMIPGKNTFSTSNTWQTLSISKPNS